MRRATSCVLATESGGFFVAAPMTNTPSWGIVETGKMQPAGPHQQGPDFEWRDPWTVLKI